jgi:prephenate dehydrogenase
MGRWFARYLLKEGYEVIISGRDEARLASAGRDLGVTAASNVEVVNIADTVLLSVSIDSFEEVIKEIAPYVRPEQMIFDITSIKEFTVEVMHRYLKSANILGTHPLFGPGARDLANQNFILTPDDAREIDLSQRVKKYLEARGTRVSLLTPKEHDEMMSVVLGLAHFVSIVAADTLAGLGRLPQMKAIGGSTYRVLTTLVESVISEDPELYATLQVRLPHLVEIESLFQMNAARWAYFVRNKDKQAFIDSLNELKEKYAESNSDFGQAYENMYKIMEWL